jgi:hypothetical protein
MRTEPHNEQLEQIGSEIMLLARNTLMVHFRFLDADFKRNVNQRLKSVLKVI